MPTSATTTKDIPGVLASAQNECCALIDVEGDFNPRDARWAGVDVRKLLVAQPDDDAQAVETAVVLIASGTVRLIAFTAPVDGMDRVVDTATRMQAKVFVPEPAPCTKTDPGTHDLIRKLRNRAYALLDLAIGQVELETDPEYAGAAIKSASEEFARAKQAIRDSLWLAA